ncbi:MAG: hypothetical protein ACOYOU_04865 [Kiritimatiellia bacterium]
MPTLFLIQSGLAGSADQVPLIWLYHKTTCRELYCIVTIAEARQASAIYLLNAVRGMHPVRLL